MKCATCSGTGVLPVKGMNNAFKDCPDCVGGPLEPQNLAARKAAPKKKRGGRKSSKKK